jgi:hypothetical protein
MFRNVDLKSLSMVRLVLAVSFALLAASAFGQHVHQLLYNNSDWADTDLTYLTGGPDARPYGVTASTRRAINCMSTMCRVRISIFTNSITMARRGPTAT